MLLHGTVIGGAATVFWPSPPAPEPETIPIYFEVVEAAALDAAEQPVELEDGGRGATALPVPSGSVPEDTGSVPIEDTGPVPIDNEGSVPIDSVPDSGSVPVTEEVKALENEEITGENLENEEVPRAEPETAVEKSADDKEGEAPQSPSSAAASEEHAAVVSDPIALNRIVPVYPRPARWRYLWRRMVLLPMRRLCRQADTGNWMRRHCLRCVPHASPLRRRMV